MKNLRVRSFINEVFNIYSKYFLKLYTLCILLTSFFFIIVAVLFKYSRFGSDVAGTWVTLYHALFNKYSVAGTYSIVDLSKTIYLFFAALLAMSLFGKQFKGTRDETATFIKSLNIVDVGILVLFAGVACSIDILLYFLEYNALKAPLHVDTSAWIHAMIFELRIYLPIIVLAMAVSQRLLTKDRILNWYALLTLVISAWLFNQFAFELSVLVRNFIFTSITVNLSDFTTKSIVESILSIPLFAIFLPGFAAVLYLPLSFFKKQSSVKEG